MTISYDTIKLKSASSEEAVDRLYKFDATMTDGADGKKDGKIDRLEAIKEDPAKLSKLLCLDRGGFKQSRFFVSSEGIVETFFAMTESADGVRAEEHLIGYEIRDNEFIAPENIGNAFKGEEFASFITACRDAYGPLMDSLLSLVKGNELAASDVDMGLVAAELAKPDASLKKILMQLYKPAFIETNKALIEETDLLHRYLQQGAALSKTNPGAYKAVDKAAPRDLNAFVPKMTATPPAPPPPAVAAPVVPAPEAVAAAPAVPAKAELAPVQIIMIPVETPDLDTIREAIATIDRIYEEALPTPGGKKLTDVQTKKLRGGKTVIADQDGRTDFMGAGTEYAFDVEGVRKLRRDLWQRVKRADPEKFYFTTASVSIRTTELVRSSGFINFPERSADLTKATGNDKLDLIIEELKKADPASIASIKLIGYASATEEYVMDGGAKVKITTANIEKYIDPTTNELKSGFTWAEGPKPPTGSNKTKWGPARHAALRDYLIKKGVSKTLLDNAAITTTEARGGAFKPTATLEFTYKEISDFDLKLSQFAGVPEDKQAKLAGLLEKTDVYFKACRDTAAKTSLSADAKRREMLVAAVAVEEYLSNPANFGRELAKSVAKQLFELIDAQSYRLQGADVLMQVLNVTFHDGTLVAKGPAPTPPAKKTPDEIAADKRIAESAGVLGAMREAEAAANNPKLPAKTSDFRLNSGPAPSFTVTGDASQIASIRLPWGKGYTMTPGNGFTVSGQTVTLTKMQEIAKAWATEWQNDPNGDFAYTGVDTYTLTVKFKDGTRAKISATATGE